MSAKSVKKTKKSPEGRYPFGGTIGPGGYRELHDPGAHVVYRVINPSTGITHEFDNKTEALKKAEERSRKERGSVGVEQGTMTSAGVFRYDLNPQNIWSSEWRQEGSTRHHATKKSPAQLDRDIAEALGRVPSDDPELQAKWRVEPSELRVGQRFDAFGKQFEIVKIGRDKAKTIQIARRYATPSGREAFYDHRSFPMREFYQQYLRPLRD